ncbi:hypothetical protein DL96DRAFT_1619837 [Flagelloscypha sp. PMI_526]|nr:hypothetical protein DL96DRAFT_1619837 [Flagelloscypha sp. PMI_526]
MMSLNHLEDYQRYGRQMILDGFGLEGQLKLQRASVLVVGAGGLGCPALQYLCAAGVGKLGIIDHDVVELSNLQRQILHSTESLNMTKVQSAALSLNRINPTVQVEAMAEGLTPENAIRVITPYDVVLDCTDNAPTRYLLSDSCVALRKPLVSGAAQRFEGQLCIYNLHNTGPCYRCFFPRPPAQDTVGTCADTGVLGAVTGIIGNLQALETIKLLTGFSEPMNTLLLYSALSPTPFRTIKLRPRKPGCSGCAQPSEQIASISETDYIQFCGGPPPDWETRGMSSGVNLRVNVHELAEVLKNETGQYRMIDVRPRVEFGICHLPGSINIPIQELVANPASFTSEVDTYIICRLGNDSQIAAELLQSDKPLGQGKFVKDVKGGLRAWSKYIDPAFPVY